MSGEEEWTDYDSGPDIRAQMRLEDMQERAEKAEAKLKRYREREPLVQAALRDAEGYSQYETLHQLVRNALEFKIEGE